MAEIGIRLLTLVAEARRGGVSYAASGSDKAIAITIAKAFESVRVRFIGRIGCTGIRLLEPVQVLDSFFDHGGIAFHVFRRVARGAKTISNLFVRERDEQLTQPLGVRHRTLFD